MTKRLPTFLFTAALGLTACSTPAPAPEDPAPVEEPPPPPETTTETPPPPREQPAEVEKPAEAEPVRYTGRTVVATQVERTQIRCAGATEGATLAENRSLCAQALQAQVPEPDKLILVIDETPGAGCPTCVTMLAEVSAVASDPPGRVLVAKDEAGQVECSGGDAKLTLADTRAQCYATLQREGGSLRASVVLPGAIEEGQPCKSCISIVATGYTATIIP